MDWRGVALEALVHAAAVGMGGVLTITLVRRYAARLSDRDGDEVQVLRHRPLG